MSDSIGWDGGSGGGVTSEGGCGGGDFSDGGTGGGFVKEVGCDSGTRGGSDGGGALLTG